LKVLEDSINDAKTLQLFVLLEGCQLVIEVVVVKLLLDLSFAEAQLIHLELLVVSVTPLLVYVLFVEVVGFWRNEGALQLSLGEIIPRKVSEPDMLLDFLNPFSTQPMLSLPLDHAVYEIRRGSRPTRWNFLLSYLHLLLQNMVSDLLARLAHIRPLHTISNHLSFLPDRTCIRMP